MLKNRYRIRYMLFSLMVSVVFFPGYLKAVEYKFTRGWYGPTARGSDKSGFGGHTANGIIIQSNNGNDDGVLRFRLEYRSSPSPYGHHPDHVNTRLSVELQPRNLPDDEQALIQQIKSRVPGDDPQENRVARILNVLSSPHITTSVRRALISTLAGRYNARITGFDAAEATTVNGVLFLEDLVQLLRILKSRLPEEQFNQLVNAVVQLRIPCFLPEAMVFHQSFPLVHFGESRNNNPTDATRFIEHSSTVQISLYTDPAMSIISPGTLILSGQENFRLHIPGSMNFHGWVLFEERHPPHPFRAPASLNRWYPLVVEQGGTMPAGNPSRFSGRRCLIQDTAHQQM